MERGQAIWTKKLDGPAHGHRPGYGRYLEWAARPLVVRIASRRYRCPDCQAIIEQGELHGSTFYDHYCLDCSTGTRPETRHERVTIESPKSAQDRPSFIEWTEQAQSLTAHVIKTKHARMAYRRNETPQQYADTMSHYAQKEQERITL